MHTAKTDFTTAQQWRDKQIFSKLNTKTTKTITKNCL